MNQQEMHRHFMALGGHFNPIAKSLRSAHLRPKVICNKKRDPKLARKDQSWKVS